MRSQPQQQKQIKPTHNAVATNNSPRNSSPRLSYPQHQRSASANRATNYTQQQQQFNNSNNFNLNNNNRSTSQHNSRLNNNNNYEHPLHGTPVRTPGGSSSNTRHTAN